MRRERIPGARAYTRVNDGPPCVPPPLPIGHRLSLPFALSGVRALYAARAAAATTNDDSLTVDGAARNPRRRRVSRRCATRVCRAPAARRLTEGRSLPGDSTLVCAAYHQFPLILNRIQRTKPTPGHPTATARCVHRYRSARAHRIPGVPGIFLCL